MRHSSSLNARSAPWRERSRVVVSGSAVAIGLVLAGAALLRGHLGAQATAAGLPPSRPAVVRANLGVSRRDAAAVHAFASLSSRAQRAPSSGHPAVVRIAASPRPARGVAPGSSSPATPAPAPASSSSPPASQGQGQASGDATSGVQVPGPVPVPAPAPAPVVSVPNVPVPPVATPSVPLPSLTPTIPSLPVSLPRVLP